jgi:hypothetical protein
MTMQLITHMMKVHPIQNAGLVASEVGKSLLAAVFAICTTIVTNGRKLETCLFSRHTIFKQAMSDGFW